MATAPALDLTGQLAIDPIATDGLGRYTSFDISPEPMYSEDALGPELYGAIHSMCNDDRAASSYARRVELLQTWEARLFDRGHQYLLPNKQGWEIFGDNSRGGQIGEQNSAELFSVNMYGARKDKIVAAMTRQVPGIEFFAKDSSNPVDLQSADEANKYRYLWASMVDAKTLAVAIAGLFYTDDRILLYTRSVADQQRWGTDEMGQPVVNEDTTAFGKLEHSVPLYVDQLSQMGRVSLSQDFDQNTLKERYPWLDDKVSNEGLDSYDSLERTARMSVKAGTMFGVTGSKDVPERMIWLRPSQYRAAQRDQRQMLYQMFPSGIKVVYVGNKMAFVRNESINDSLELRHSRHGFGQNRRSIGANNLPLQKVLNKNITLLNRYFTSCVPSKWANPEFVDVDAINNQVNDPALIRAMKSIPGNGAVEDAFYVEPVPSPNPQMFEYAQWLNEGAPETMDGGSSAMFGASTNTDTLGGIIEQNAQALQVFGTPYDSMALGLAKACEQAAKWATRTRQGKMNSMVPSQGRVSVDLDKMRGEMFCFPEVGDGIPESAAQKQARLYKMIEESPNIPTYQTMLAYAKNLPALQAALQNQEMEVPGADSVVKQLSEIEKLKAAQPVDNPQFTQANVQLQSMEQELQANPQATPEMQQGLQQAQQQLQQVPPKVTSIAVVQDASENHPIEAAICVWWLNSTEGQKFKSGNPVEQLGFQNVTMHWQDHMSAAAKLAPPAMPVVKPGITMAVDKLGPSVQAQVLAKEYGIQADPADLAPSTELQPHEIIQEKTGVDENGVPVKQRIAMAKGGSVTS